MQTSAISQPILVASVLWCKNPTQYLALQNSATNTRQSLNSDAVENRLNGKTTSKAERVMRTVNMRVNVSKWSKSGALNATKIRLAYYYNSFDA